jgi:hypothetical protein
MSKRDLAEQLFTLYYEAIHAAHPKRVANSAPAKVECTKCGKYFFAHSYAKLCEDCRKTKPTKARSLRDLNKTGRAAFLAAARACLELDADPREFIAAQFAMWREMSAYHQKLLWPMPSQLGSEAARSRFLMHKAREEVRISRVSVVEDQDEKRRWFVEERTLKSLARVQRRDPIDVLTEQPEEFSRGFLEHKGVWDVVADLWDERQRS